ncbi:MAG: hypothetical protein DME93_11540 [Verrucomicrobia bacterium]|nr:MAG: hypothetical protein DME93_11540 [Verrucomicrobiota bacterium]
MPIWRKLMKVAQQVFTITERFPKEDDCGLSSQIGRSWLSVSRGHWRKHLSFNRLQS